MTRILNTRFMISVLPLRIVRALASFHILKLSVYFATLCYWLWHITSFALRGSIRQARGNCLVLPSFCLYPITWNCESRKSTPRTQIEWHLAMDAKYLWSVLNYYYSVHSTLKKGTLQTETSKLGAPLEMPFRYAELMAFLNRAAGWIVDMVETCYCVHNG